MHPALCWAGRSLEDIAWLFLPGACSDLSRYTQASSSFGERKGDAVSTSLEISAKSSWTLQRWRRGWEQRFQCRGPALHPCAQLQKALLPPLFLWSLRVNHKSLLHSHGLFSSYRRTVCERLRHHLSLPLGGSMGCRRCQQQAAPSAAHPTWGCFPLWLCEREAKMWSLTHKWCSVCSLILSRLPGLPRVPCQSLHPRHSMTAICHGEPR